MNNSFFQQDRADGAVAAATRLAVIDGIAGWLVTTDAEGRSMAYAPMWYTHLYGEIAREI